MNPIRVLVVEDSLTIRRHIIEALEADPTFQVVGEADDGPEAIALCAKLRPDVMTLDMVLRTTSGLEVTDRIELWWQADEPAATAVRDGAELLAREVLAVTVDEGAPAAPLAEHSLADPPIRFWLREAGT